MLIIKAVSGFSMESSFSKYIGGVKLNLPVVFIKADLKMLSVLGKILLTKLAPSKFENPSFFISTLLPALYKVFVPSDAQPAIITAIAGIEKYFFMPASKYLGVD